MDLVHGARKVVVMSDHTTRKGAAKLLRYCALPLTAKGVVQRVITDPGVLDTAGDHFRLIELAPDVGGDQLIAATDAPVSVTTSRP